MHTKLVSILLLALAGFGCGSSNDSGGSSTKGTYELDVTGFDAHAGATIRLKVKDETGATMGGETTFPMTATGKGQLVVPGILEDGKSYRVDFFADTNNDGAYAKPNPPDFPEHSWRRQITGKAAGVTESFTHNSSWVDITPY